MNYRAIIQEQVEGDDWSNEQATWKNVGSTYLMIRTMGGREASYAQQQHATATIKAEANWDKRLTPDKRLKLSDGRILEINAVNNMDERNTKAVLTCTWTR